MTPSEAFETIVRAGVCDAGGHLAPEYRRSRLVYAEYVDGEPHAAVTERDGVWTSWDIDPCRRDGCAYFQESGSGPAGDGFALRGSAPPGVVVSLWSAAPLVVGDGPADAAAVAARGYIVLSEEPDPFSGAREGATTRCRVCADWLPEDDPCDHVRLCPECSWVGPGAERSCAHYRRARRRLARAGGRGARAVGVAPWRVTTRRLP